MSKKIAIIDYQMSNLFSVKNSLDSLGFETLVTHKAEEILNADGAVLPGVGAFGDSMNHLNDLNLVTPIKEFIASGKPFMGICLGLQLLLTESDEFGSYQGLGVIEGRVESLSNYIGEDKIVPHVGWNKINVLEENKNLMGRVPVEDDTFMYFVHSYFVNPKDKSIVCTETEYEGYRFCSSIRKDNIFATQFHPEKGCAPGLRLLKNFFQ